MFTIRQQNRYDYARQALGKAGGKEAGAIDLIVGWYHKESDVRRAFIPEDEVLRRFARQAIRKVRREQRERAG